MNCPDCEIPMYELLIERQANGELSKCPRCGYKDNVDGKRYDWNQRDGLRKKAAFKAHDHPKVLTL